MVGAFVFSIATVLAAARPGGFACGELDISWGSIGLCVVGEVDTIWAENAEVIHGQGASMWAVAKIRVDRVLAGTWESETVDVYSTGGHAARRADFDPSGPIWPGYRGVYLLSWNPGHEWWGATLLANPWTYAVDDDIVSRVHVTDHGWSSPTWSIDPPSAIELTPVCALADFADEARSRTDAFAMGTVFAEAEVLIVGFVVSASRWNANVIVQEVIHDRTPTRRIPKEVRVTGTNVRKPSAGAKPDDFYAHLWLDMGDRAVLALSRTPADGDFLLDGGVYGRARILGVNWIPALGMRLDRVRERWGQE